MLLFVKNCLQLVDCQALGGLPFEESVWCLIKLSNSERMLVGVCYRSPNSVMENDEHLINILASTKRLHVRHVLVMGDFNYPQIDWHAGKVEGSDDSCQVWFYEIVQDLFWIQYVDFPTRFRVDQIPSQLDLVFTNQEYAIDEIKSSAPLGKSDHMVLTWNYQLHSHFSTSQARTPKHNFNRGRYEEMSRELEGASWRLSDNMTIDMMWNRIKEVLGASIERHIPLMKKQSGQKKICSMVE